MLTTTDRGVMTFLLFRGVQLCGRSFAGNGLTEVRFNTSLTLEEIVGDAEYQRLVGALEATHALLGSAKRRESIGDRATAWRR